MFCRYSNMGFIALSENGDVIVGWRYRICWWCCSPAVDDAFPSALKSSGTQSTAAIIYKT